MWLVLLRYYCYCYLKASKDALHTCTLHASVCVLFCCHLWMSSCTYDSIQAIKAFYLGPHDHQDIRFILPIRIKHSTIHVLIKCSFFSYGHSTKEYQTTNQCPNERIVILPPFLLSSTLYFSKIHKKTLLPFPIFLHPLPLPLPLTPHFPAPHFPSFPLSIFQRNHVSIKGYFCKIKFKTHLGDVNKQIWRWE